MNRCLGPYHRHISEINFTKDVQQATHRDRKAEQLNTRNTRLKASKLGKSRAVLGRFAMAPLGVKSILKRTERSEEANDRLLSPPAQSEGKDGSRCGEIGAPRVDGAGIELACAACERGGLSMLELRDAQQADAWAQEGLTGMVGDLLDAIVFNCSEHGHTEKPGVLPCFESADAISCKLSYYVGRMVRYTNISPCNLMVGLIYLQRINTLSGGGLRLTPYNCQRLLLVASMLASKFYDDYFASNKCWAQVGGMCLLCVSTCLEREREGGRMYAGRKKGVCV